MKSISTKQKSKIINFSLFIGLVILPWLLVIYYVMTLAHPRFVSTADVVVKQVSDSSVPTGGGLSALLG
ncbi:MAG: capsule biosynthesis protein, partial [Psychrobacter sp.]